MKGRGEEDGRRTVGRKRKEGRNIGRKQPPNKLTKATITNTFIFFVPKPQTVQRNKYGR